MLAIASMLDTAADKKTQELWDWLDEHCGMNGIKLTPLPHFSWQSAGNYHIEKVEEILGQIASETEPFEITTSGYGIFSGLSPVLYLAIVKTECLLKLHKQIWNETLPYVGEKNAYYGPDLWVPHISLAYHDLNSDTIACAMKDLLSIPSKMTISVNNLVLIYQIGDVDGIRSKFVFKCQSNPVIENQSS
jgi:2'-5' RNA ligase